MFAAWLLATAAGCTSASPAGDAATVTVVLAAGAAADPPAGQPGLAGRGGSGSAPLPAAGSPAPAGRAGAPAPLPPAAAPTPTPSSPIPSVGIGVSDLARSIAFYTGPMGMTQAGELERDGRTETVLVARSRGMTIALMQFTDGQQRSFEDIPVKLVFAVPDKDAAAQRITQAGYTFTVPGLFAADPDGYTVELMEQPSADYSIVAFGLGVADSKLATDFYTGAMGMKAGELSNFGSLEETLLTGGGLGCALALVHYNDGGQHNYKDNPVKVVFAVPSAADALERIVQAGRTIVSPPAAVATLGNATVGVAKDPDGYLVELLQR